MSVNFHHHISATPPRIAIEGEMTIFHAGELKGQLLNALTGAEELEIDLEQVTDFDGAGLQLLMLIRREAIERGIELRITRYSRAVADTFELLDMTSYFGHSGTASSDAAEVGGAVL